MDGDGYRAPRATRIVKPNRGVSRPEVRMARSRLDPTALPPAARHGRMASTRRRWQGLDSIRRNGTGR
jgi:hypothetical protein